MADEDDSINIPEMLRAVQRATSHFASRMAAQGRPLHMVDIRRVASKAVDAFATGRVLTIDDVDGLVARAMTSLELETHANGKMSGPKGPEPVAVSGENTHCRSLGQESCPCLQCSQNHETKRFQWQASTQGTD